MNKIEWTEDKNGDGWNSACGRYRIAQCQDGFMEGKYFELSWLGSYGQTSKREYNSLSDSKRAATMRARKTKVAR